ncbi:NAD(P)-dependent oxidoreductase [Chitinophaga nivalis]|uniref:NAD(P)-binding domain-containing protein n=1 Tax=Chitinophaga nivalis TaxID=2991709 RepID=A0ABT3IET9_9BACT|nr:NAD(P)-binding domain-containing protein [Chitinophaga nivalis]MCW3467835.1 NAD(P)-binding domain-containing protein [Chitinophaga nivalis]MCW3482473.1 NAD(P)-binding domain-containing protein [Chitinophaga nivalis]
MENKAKDAGALTVIGLGPMGRAMAAAYLHKGYQVTVWNRTPEKAAQLIEKGVVLAPDITAAVKANELLIISLTEYATMYSVLEPAKAELKGKTIVNMSSDSPGTVAAAADWAANLGAYFLSGGIMVPPPYIGQEGPEIYTFYSGKKTIFDRYQAVLSVMTATDFRGEDPRLAMLYYQGLLDYMYASVAGLLHAIALMQSAGITAAAFEPYLHNFMQFMPVLLAESATSRETDERTYSGAENNMVMLRAGTEHVLKASREAGINTTLPEMIFNLSDAAVAQGFGKSGINSLIEVLRKPVM